MLFPLVVVFSFANTLQMSKPRNVGYVVIICAIVVIVNMFHK